MLREGSPDSPAVTAFSPAWRACWRVAPCYHRRRFRFAAPWKACRRLGTSLHEHRSAALSCRWPWFHPLCVRPWPA